MAAYKIQNIIYCPTAAYILIATPLNVGGQGQNCAALRGGRGYYGNDYAGRKKAVKKVHNIILEDRRALTVSGVSDVDSFDEEVVMLFTELGELTIRGSDLHMNKLNVETGEVNIEGSISSLSYQDDTPRKSGGFMGKLFR